MSFQINPDPMEGMRQAVLNGQLRLALDYAVAALDELKSEVAELKAAPSASSSVKRASKKTMEEASSGDG